MLDRLMAQPLPKEFPLEGYIRIARAYDICGRTEKMIAPVKRYLQEQPGEWRVWITLAVAYQKLKMEGNALGALQRAQELGRSQAMQAAYEMPSLRPLVQQLAQQGRGAGALGLPGLPR
jgi:predicted Zn-dependent protease